jgi:hypothetical protein
MENQSEQTDNVEQPDIEKVINRLKAPKNLNEWIAFFNDKAGKNLFPFRKPNNDNRPITLKEFNDLISKMRLSIVNFLEISAIQASLESK